MKKTTALLSIAALLLAVLAPATFGQEPKRKQAPSIKLVKKLAQIGNPVDLSIGDAITAERDVVIEQKQDSTGYTVRVAEPISTAVVSTKGFSRPPVKETLDLGVIINQRTDPMTHPQLLYYSAEPYAAGTVFVTTWETPAKRRTVQMERFQLDFDQTGFGILMWDGYVPNGFADGGQFCVYVNTPTTRSKQCHQVLPWNSEARMTSAYREGNSLIIKGTFPSRNIRLSINYTIVDPSAFDFVTLDTISINMFNANFFTYFGYNTLALNSNGVAFTLKQSLE